MKILLDMNLSPDWEAVFAKEGIQCRHWRDVGRPSASDRKIVDWAAENGYLVFTHDLDFGAILAANRLRLPSVIQLRSQDILPSSGAGAVLTAIERFRAELGDGALLSIDPPRARVRMLPLRSD